MHIPLTGKAAKILLDTERCLLVVIVVILILNILNTLWRKVLHRHLTRLLNADRTSGFDRSQPLGNITEQCQSLLRKLETKERILRLERNYKRNSLILFFMFLGYVLIYFISVL